MSPTQRSLALLRAENYLAEVVERWIPGANIRRDLWGWCDILAIQLTANELAAIQTTTRANMKARIRKIEESDTVSAVRKAGISIYVHGWHKKNGRWEVEIVDIS